jgi:hypothetical protein
MLLENLSRKGRPASELKELLYSPQGGSPRRSPTSNRLLYPATKVHLNHLPQTQQLPTPTFPALVGPSRQVRPGSSKPSGEKCAEGSSYDEGYHLPVGVVLHYWRVPVLLLTPQLLHYSIASSSQQDPAHFSWCTPRLGRCKDRYRFLTPLISDVSERCTRISRVRQHNSQLYVLIRPLQVDSCHLEPMTSPYQRRTQSNERLLVTVK